MPTNPSILVFFSKGKQISVVFGAKDLKNYYGERYNEVSVHEKEFDRWVPTKTKKKQQKPALTQDNNNKIRELIFLFS